MTGRFATIVEWHSRFIPAERGRGTVVGKAEKYRRGRFSHFALKMEAVVISETSAVRPTSSWCQKQGPLVITYTNSLPLCYFLYNGKFYVTESEVWICEC